MGRICVDNEGGVFTSAQAYREAKNIKPAVTLHFECGCPNCPVMAKPCRLEVTTRSAEYAPMDDSCPEHIEDANIWIKKELEMCPDCGGTGVITNLHEDGSFDERVPCDLCSGTGDIYRKEGP